MKACGYPAYDTLKGARVMIRSLSKYDYTVFSIPRSSEEIRPRYTKLIRNGAAAILTAENIFAIQLKHILRSYPAACTSVPLRESDAWKFITRQITNLDREAELIPTHGHGTAAALLYRLHKVFRSVDPDRMIPVTSARQDRTPWATSRDTSRLYSFDWEQHGRSMPLLLDFFHAVVQCNIVFYQCNDYRQVRQTIDQILESREFSMIVDKFAIDVDLHFRVYLLFATSYYFRVYIENHFPQDVIHRFIAIWHEGLTAIT